jgi:FXSXX-COOH protein
VNATQDLLASAVRDIADIPLGELPEISDEEYARIMRRIGLDEGEPGMTVSAFNSSI